MAQSRIKYGRGCAYSIQYHMIFVTKYRKKIFTPNLLKDCINIMQELAASETYKIIEANGEEDHIHLLIEATPTQNIPNIAKQLKGVTARKMFKLHPKIQQQLYGGHLWSPSYFVATTNENTVDQIREYIQKQGTK